MKNWKRGAALSAALVLALGLCACGSSTPSGVQEPPPPVEYEEPEDTGPEYEEPEYEEPDYEEPEPEPEPVKPEGLVIVKESYLSEQKEYALYCFNPDTKEETMIADFLVPYKTESGDWFSISTPGATVSRQSFSGDFTKLSDQKTFAANGERHAGWHNLDGTFTDVTETLGQQSKSDFEDPVYYRDLGFAGENFGYAYSTDGSILKEVYFYVPADNLSPGAVQEGDAQKIGHPYNEKGALLINKYGSGKYDPQYVTSWIDDTHAIVNGTGQVTSDCNSFIVDTAAQTETAYIPGDSRINWNGVISPDGSKIAFMSESKKGTDIHTDIYIIPVDGGIPVKVEGLPYDLKGNAYQTKDGTCTLIGWI